MKKSLNTNQLMIEVAALLVCLHLSAVPGLSQVIKTVAGGLLPIDGAQAITQFFDGPVSVISDRAGGFYFSTTGVNENRVYRVGADGSLTTIAGTGESGFGGDGGPALSAQLNGPFGLALDRAGNLYIADTYNSRVRKVSLAGIISTVAGNGRNAFSGDGGQAISTALNPRDVAVDGNGNLLIADAGNHRIRRVASNGTISTVAGTGSSGFSGDGGPGILARLNFPAGVAVDASGAVFIRDHNSHRVRKLSANGVITTVAGNGLSGADGDGGPATSARIGSMGDIAVDSSGSLFISQPGLNRIRKVTTGGIITTVAGNGSNGPAGDGGPATAAQLASPVGIDFDASGNLFIADSSNHRIRKVNPGGVINTVAGVGALRFSGDGGPATMAMLNQPNGIVVDSGGNLFIADSFNLRVRRVTSSGIIGPFAGNGEYGTGGDGGSATSAYLQYPGGVAVDSSGNVFITDCDRIRKVAPSGSINLFSTASWSFCDFYYYYYYYYGETGVAGGAAVDASGNLIVANTFDNRVYRISPDGTAAVIAGNGQLGFNGDGGPAVSARLSYPWAVTIDSAGTIYISDSGNNRVRKVTAGIISTVAGSGSPSFNGDGRTAVSAGLSPRGIAIDTTGNLYIADYSNHRVRKVTPAGMISTVAGDGNVGFSGDGGPATSAVLNGPNSVALDSAGNLFITDAVNNRIRRVGFNLTVPTVTRILQGFGAPGTTLTVDLEGTSFSSPLTIDAGSGVTVSNVNVVNDIRATATFTIDTNAATGARNVTVSTNLGTSSSTPFNVVPPFPDLTITSSHVGSFVPGLNSTYVVGVSNVGSGPTSGPTIVTDVLPTGLTYASSSGDGWSCSTAEQLLTCVKPDSLAPGQSTSLNLTFAVAPNAPSGLIHAPRVANAGDLIATNNATTDNTTVGVPVASLRLTPQNPTPGSQVSADVTMMTAYPFEVKGTLTLGFSSDAVNPADDPAIQFAGGGRTVTFTIPADTLQARFAALPQAGPLAFQTGTVAGTLSLNGMLATVDAQIPFSTQATIPRQRPRIESAHRESSVGADFVLGLNLTSTLREMDQLIVRFQTTPSVRLTCGAVASCSSSGNTFTLDVKSMFDNWYSSDTTFGGASRLSVPFSIQGSIRGSLLISTTNRMGTSDVVSIPIP